MPKHHKKRKHHYRRHRIGAASLNPSSPVVQLGSTAVGYFVTADPINGAIDKMNTKPATATEPATTRLNPKIVGIAEAGLGALLIFGKKKTVIKTVAGGLLAGAGLKRLLHEFGVISGYQAVPVIGGVRRKMAGYQSVPVIGGMPPQLAGAAQLQGYRVNGYTPAGSGVLGAVNPGMDNSAYGSGYMN